jgi:C4-dicarboxylate-specific signal transduction histidine kinase
MDRESFAVAPAAPLPCRVGLLCKVLLLSAPLFLVLGALAVITTTEAQRIRVDLERVVEEERELEMSKSLGSELLGAAAWAGRRATEAAPSAAVVQDLIGHIVRARRIVDGLAEGPEHEDPSDPFHEGREQQMFAELSRSLATCEKRAAEETDWTELSADLRSARRSAEVLEAESKEEAREAASDLDRRVYRLVNTLYLVAGICLVTLVLLASAFRHLVLRPLRLLQQATLDHGPQASREPVPILSRDEFGQLTHAFNDMTARLEAHHEGLEERVRERTRELIRTARLADLGTIAAGIAHEINNPLASIAAGVEGLKRELDESGTASQETLDYIQIVVTEAYRAKDIASRLLLFGRQEQRSREAVWLARQAREVGSMLAFQARQDRVEIAIELEDDLPPIQSDPGEWRQIFFNVLRNALDAAPANSTIRVTGGRSHDSLVLRIRDEGAGFPPDELDRVFEPFVTTKDPGKGTGLGLAIVERIVRENDGTVHAANWDRGGEIRIELPWPTTG